ncbi:MAG: hypothetical protein M3P51_14215 [Chloroflexota bacterium]|nr:hypothetical protein [Chloroflexota bacterium]
MLELVIIGEPKVVSQRRCEVEAVLVSAFGDLGMSGALETATDAFFLGNDEGARIVQKLKGLKQEYLVSGQKERVAVASMNDHEDYFGRCFKLTLGGPDNHAYSFCAAFGLERLTGCGLRAWGGEVGGWPQELQT